MKDTTIINDSINTFTAFGQTLHLIWGEFGCGSNQNTFARECTDRYFYVLIPGVARIWALPDENHIKIEPLNSQIGISDLNRWFYSSIIAYILQHRGYHVLHGAAVLMRGEAVIFSGHSGAGKSTLAGAMMQKGYQVLTDDLVVIQRTEQGQYCLIPGPNVLKICSDTMQQLQFEPSHGRILPFRKDKYGFNFAHAPKAECIPIRAFYEISAGLPTNTHPLMNTLSHAQALKTVMHHAYRYFMLKPLGKLQCFMNACAELIDRINVHHIQRTNDFRNLPKMIQGIEQQEGV